MFIISDRKSVNCAQDAINGISLLYVTKDNITFEMIKLSSQEKVVIFCCRNAGGIQNGRSAKSAFSIKESFIRQLENFSNIRTFSLFLTFLFPFSRYNFRWQHQST